MTLLFVKFLHVHILSRSVDCTSLALFLAPLDLAVDDFPIHGCTILPEAPFLELTLILSFAVDWLEVCLSIHGLMF
jgi:hypothetical protein